ncbi:hypothetical protein FA048_12650 [Pedobacter polaris]|uniref:DNA-binding protein n=1 Tax=Pedobacter polaris TaxID=2571273 RepID=A0A4U1CL85_9SPHI|nr:hypothetical protein [Pedobacter polaris]TKC08007.1 hypothetical protein FA048_12650 [Pedobacter polaris]
MEIEILTREELNNALNRFKADLISEFKNIVKNSDEDEWMNGEKAMNRIGCKSTKLSELASSKEIIKRGSGKGTRYSKNSIIGYLNKK